MTTHPDFEDLLRLFDENQVEYLIAFGFIGREDLIRNKRATPRAQDKVDADELSKN